MNFKLKTKILSLAMAFLSTISIFSTSAIECPIHHTNESNVIYEVLQYSFTCKKCALAFANEAARVLNPAKCRIHRNTTALYKPTFCENNFAPKTAESIYYCIFDAKCSKCNNVKKTIKKNTSIIKNKIKLFSLPAQRIMSLSEGSTKYNYKKQTCNNCHKTGRPYNHTIDGVGCVLFCKHCARTLNLMDAIENFRLLDKAVAKAFDETQKMQTMPLHK